MQCRFLLILRKVNTKCDTIKRVTHFLQMDLTEIRYLNIFNLIVRLANIPILRPHLKQKLIWEGTHFTFLCCCTDGCAHTRKKSATFLENIWSD